MSSLPTSSLSDWGSLRPRAPANAAVPRTRPSAVARSQRPGPDVGAPLSVSRYQDGASLKALAALTLSDRERLSLSGRALDVIGNDAVGSQRPSSSKSVRPGEYPSGIVERRNVSELSGPRPSRPSCA
jgi:hypothetical protein